MYAVDNSYIIVPNAPLGALADDRTWCGNQSEDWHWNTANTNWAFYQKSIMAPFMGNQVGVYRCPADTIPSDNGLRVRSVSMQGQMGNLYIKSTTQTYNPNYKAYVKLSEVVYPLSPVDAIVFVDENMCGLNDGYLQVSLASDNGWPDVPGAYHDFKGSTNFADGHAEIHKWLTSALKIPVRYGFGWPQGNYPTFSGGHNKADLVWWKGTHFSAGAMTPRPRRFQRSALPVYAGSQIRLKCGLWFSQTCCLQAAKLLLFQVNI